MTSLRSEGPFLRRRRTHRKGCGMMWTTTRRGRRARANQSAQSVYCMSLSVAGEWRVCGGHGDERLPSRDGKPAAVARIGQLRSQFWQLRHLRREQLSKLSINVSIQGSIRSHPAQSAADVARSRVRSFPVQFPFRTSDRTVHVGKRRRSRTEEGKSRPRATLPLVRMNWLTTTSSTVL